MTDGIRRSVVVVGATGNLGGRIAKALGHRPASVRALVRPGTPAEKQNAIRAYGVEAVEVDFADTAALTEACRGAECIVSAVSGLAPVIVDLQSRVLDAGVAAGVARFIPSDFCLDFTKTRPGDNRNLDLRRTFKDRLDRAPIRATSILNGPFADILKRAPFVQHGRRRILYWGDADQPFDFTTMDDVADYTADAALDADAPRILRIAGDVVSSRNLAEVMTRLERRAWRPHRAGGITLLGLVIWIMRKRSTEDATFPPSQGLQYVRDMATGRGKLTPLDNGRYGERHWNSVEDVLATTLET